MQVQSWLQASNNTGILNTCTWLWLTESEHAPPPRRFNKGHSSKFHVGSWVCQTPEEGWRTYQLKRCGNNNKDEDNSPKTLNDKNHKASFPKFRQKMKSQVRSKQKNKINLPGCNYYSTCDRILLYAVVIHFLLQKRILSEFYSGYPEMARIKSLIRYYAFWPGVDKDIEKTARNYVGCARAAKSPLIKSNTWPKEDAPWARLHIDFVGPFNGSHYLVVVDSFSKWREIFKCRKLTSTVTINFLHELFTKYGLSDKIFLIMHVSSLQMNSESFVKLSLSSILPLRHITIGVMVRWKGS